MNEMTKAIKSQQEESNEYSVCYGANINDCLASVQNYQGLLVSGCISTTEQFRVVTENWLEHKRHFVKKSTYVKYHTIVYKHILPHFGNLMLSEVDRSKLNNMIYEKYFGVNCEKLSEKTLSDILSVLRLIIRFAEEQNYNCVELRISLPPEITRKNDILKDHVYANKHSPKHLGILTVMFTGLRIGEICALKWQDIDAVNKTIIVSRTLQRISDLSSREGYSKTKLVFDTPKTPSSKREIPLPYFLFTILNEEKERHPSDTYVLSGTYRPEEPRSYLNFFKKQLAACEIPPYTFHTLRHTFATNCVEAGFDIKSLSEILGHSSVQITLNRYVHPSLEAKRRQMELLSHSFSQSTQLCDHQL